MPIAVSSVDNLMWLLIYIINRHYRAGLTSVASNGFQQQQNRSELANLNHKRIVQADKRNRGDGSLRIGDIDCEWGEWESERKRQTGSRHWVANTAKSEPHTCSKRKDSQVVPAQAERWLRLRRSRTSGPWRRWLSFPRAHSTPEDR